MRKALGERIEHYRKLKKLSQAALASAMGVDKHTVWRWEDGRSWPEYDKLESIAKHLEIHPERLFETIGKSVVKQPQKPSALLLSLIQEALKLDDDGLSLILEAIRVHAKRSHSKAMGGLKDAK